MPDEIARSPMRPIRVLLVDDEPLARHRVRSLLAGEPDIELLGECDNGSDAVRRALELRPDLLFLDVQMPGLDGFGVLHALRHAPLPLVVFVTAYDQFALRAFDVHALDYVLKPVSTERFRRVLARARALLHEGADAPERHRLIALLDEVARRDTASDRVVLRTGGRLVFVRMTEIEWIEVAGNQVRVHAGGRVHVARETLSALEARLDPSRHVRVNRSAIVNLDHIVELQPWFQGDYIIVLRDGTRLTTGAAYRARVRELLGNAE
jgi:two-component system LytT family response regulator